MGGGSWDVTSFKSYTKRTKKADLDDFGFIKTSMSNQEMFKQRSINKDLNPLNVIRECKDSDEHPNTIPVILALDVTGSMGDAAVEVAKKLNGIMTSLYEKIKDVEFMIMGIGDFYCDTYPLQVSQFESDIRIAEQLDKLYFEFGGGGNAYESYTISWYFGLKHCDLDCFSKRGKRAIIITMGDERLNPYIPIEGHFSSIKSSIGDDLQGDIDTRSLYEDAVKKFDIYHLNVDHKKDYSGEKENIEKSFKEYLDDDHFKTVNMDNIADEIVNIICKASTEESVSAKPVFNNDISW